jgi:hypothetical protein
MGAFLVQHSARNVFKTAIFSPKKQLADQDGAAPHPFLFWDAKKVPRRQ